MSDEQTDFAREQNPRQTLWLNLFVTTEGRIFALGLGLALIGLIVMGTVALWSPETSSMIGAMAFTNIAFGRVVSMSIGYAAGYSHWLVIPVNMVIETILVLLFYPLFVFSLKQLLIFPALKSLLGRTHAAAARHEDKVRPYGIIGLFAFVWFPFWMTGPVVGSVLGYLLGFSALLNLSVVLAGTYFAMVVWAYFLFGIQKRAAELGSFAPALIIAIVIIVIAVGYLANNRRKNNSASQKDQDTTGEDKP